MSRSNDKNMLKQNDDAVITIEQMEELLEKYDIGKKPLSKLLGWGETTVLRYLEGDRPTKEYSEKLLFLYSSPSSYYEVLENGKDRLTGVAYRKSLRAVEQLLYGSKIKNVAKAVLLEMKDEHAPSLLQYYCYYAQVLSMYLYGKELFEEEYQTSENLSPYSEALEEIHNLPEIWRHNGKNTIAVSESSASKSSALKSLVALSKKEQTLIREVVFAFRWYGIETVRGMVSHERNFLKITYTNGNIPIITKETLKQYFKKEFDSQEVREPKDFRKYVKSIAEKIIQ